MMKYSDAVEKIFSLRQLGMKLGLENVKNFLAEIGNPQLKLKTFHVAGSNGKGSTVAFISSILQEAGFKVGMFTSPHFVDFTERIKINGKEIEKDFVVKFIERNLEAVEKKRITFFEITTALAFAYFYEQKVDYAVIETGLGGRLDATNTMNPLAEIITTISFEHTRILGETLPEIAREKAGIIKEGSRVFCGVMPTEARAEIEKTARAKKSEFFALEDFAQIERDYVRLHLLENKNFTIYKTGFVGAHQLRNAALAALAVQKTLPVIDVSAINNGILNVAGNTDLAGRFEIVSERPFVVFDAAHNYEGVSIFLEEFAKQSAQKSCAKKILIYGALRDKNVSEILKLFKDKFDKIYLTAIDFYRALTTDELFAIAEKIGLKNVAVLEGKSEFICDFIRTEKNDCLAVIGSIYLLGEIKKEMRRVTSFLIKN
jgi:dihydrofolate synthase/folylpolyglutamate synthase